MPIENPFRNLYRSVMYCPPESRERLLSNVFSEWDDMTHDANPLEHTEIITPDKLAEYLSWDGAEGDVEDVDACMMWVNDMECAFDLITPRLEPDEDGGQYISSRDFWWATESTVSNPWQRPEFDTVYDVRFQFLDEAETVIIVRVENHETYSIVE